ncbi:hypothetical protein [Pseudoduganella umbonata]|uniref:Type II secretion system protein n=1 Tax=Pseudoduganella umbonata TaxID=864828 RepID=A0A4P8HJJ7_9BURK|nr:hypothetical protein [Pseudoduganella umbonata]MBB3219657.1 hypothetical protein [Pseudoduganella umbonata]QCP09717.1 hypothetical protein FCL38_04235 [Pseudoduganella umbonata]
MGAVPRRARGATRFEFALCAILFSVLAGVLLYYVLRYRAEAELAGVRYQVASIRTTLAGKIMEAVVAGDIGRLQALAGTNPVALLEHPPPGYRGEVDQLDGQEIPRGSWVFDRKQRKLVYLFSGNKNFSGRHYAYWSYRVESLCLPTNNAKPPGTPAKMPKLSVALHQVDG